jgi:hypothetical protein
MCSAILLYWRNSDAVSLGRGLSSWAAGVVLELLTTGGAGAVGPSSPEMVAMSAGGISCNLGLIVEYFLPNNVRTGRDGVLRTDAKDGIRFIRWRWEVNNCT